MFADKFTYAHRGSQGDSKPVDLMSPSLCSDARLCLTFEYAVTRYGTELQVLRQCGDGQQPSDIAAYTQYDRSHWKSDNVTVQSCSGTDTKVKRVNSRLQTISIFHMFVVNVI